jgi:3-deoxy-D-manno-octulosonate 8-phosphate phosphatase (KDO 8-P phosphatase)
VKPTVFILDVDGVMTDGASYYTADGKVMKRFGPDDHDALKLLNRTLPVRFISGDARGFDITARRIRDDMGFPLDLVSTIQRRRWIEERYDLSGVVYMGDGFFDALVMERVGYALAPANAWTGAKAVANFVTQANGGDRAVAEACVHLMERFFVPLDLAALEAGDPPVAAAGTA